MDGGVHVKDFVGRGALGRDERGGKVWDTGSEGEMFVVLSALLCMRLVVGYLWLSTPT